MSKTRFWFNLINWSKTDSDLAKLCLVQLGINCQRYSKHRNVKIDFLKGYYRTFAWYGEEILNNNLIFCSYRRKSIRKHSHSKIGLLISVVSLNLYIFVYNSLNLDVFFLVRSEVVQLKTSKLSKNARVSLSDYFLSFSHYFSNFFKRALIITPIAPLRRKLLNPNEIE